MSGLLGDRCRGRTPGHPNGWNDDTSSQLINFFMKSHCGAHSRTCSQLYGDVSEGGFEMCVRPSNLPAHAHRARRKR